MKGDNKRMKEGKAQLPYIYDFDFLLNRAEEITSDFCNDQANGVKDAQPQNMTNQVYNAVLADIGRSLFRNIDISNDGLLLCIMFDLYNYIACKHDKIISLEGFAFICGIAPEIVQSWAQDAKSLQKSDLLDNRKKALYILYTNYINSNQSDKQYINDTELYYINPYNILSETDKGQYMNESTAVKGHIYNKIAFFRESGIKNKMLSAKQQLGVVAVVNREFGWSADRIGQEERARALTLSDLPKLSNYVNESKPPEITQNPETA